MQAGALKNTALLCLEKPVWRNEERRNPSRDRRLSQQEQLSPRSSGMLSPVPSQWVPPLPPAQGEMLTPAGEGGAVPPPRRLMLRTGHCYLATAEGCGFNPTRYPAPSSPASFPEEWAQFPSELGSNWGIIFFPPLLSFFWSILLGCFRHTRCPASWSVLGWDESWLCHPMGKAAGSLG